MSNFRTIDRQTQFLLPPSVDDWLPEKHLARFVVEVIDGRRVGEEVTPLAPHSPGRARLTHPVLRA